MATLRAKRANEAGEPRAASPKKAPARRADAGAAAERILAAADELFCRRGFDAVSVAEIGARASVTKALVFYHYESKAALFDLVLGRYYDAHTAALATAFAAEGPLAFRLHRVVDAYLDFMAENQSYAALVQQQAAAPATRARIRRHLEPLVRFVDDALAGTTPPAGPLASRQFFVTFSGMVTHYFAYAPLLGAAFGGDPMSRRALDERRAHVHWLVDAVLARLEVEVEGAAPRGRKPRRPARAAPVVVD